jgi:tripartite-type tricarboxylate transporter receptor subunit TctC
MSTAHKTARADAFVRGFANSPWTGNDLVAPERRSPAYLQRFVESEIEKWAAVIKAAGVSAD